MATYTNATQQRKGLASSLNIIVEGEVDEGIDLDSPSSTSSAQDSIGSSGQLSNGDTTYYYRDNQYSHVMPRSSGRVVDENRTLRFVGRRGLAIGDGEDIKSSKGTVRGVKNRVRAGIANFEFHPLHEGSVSILAPCIVEL